MGILHKTAKVVIVVRFWFLLAQKLPPYQNNRFGENMAQIVYQNSIIYSYWFGANFDLFSHKIL